MVFELLVADQPRARGRARPRLEVLALGRPGGRHRRAASRPDDAPGAGRQPSGDGRQPRRLHPVRPLRPRLPRGPGQRRDRHGLPRPPREGRLRLRRPDGPEHLRRLRRVRPGLPDRRADAGVACSTTSGSARGYGRPRRSTASARICGVGCQLTYHIKDDRILYVDGRDGPANHNRLCVKGRFGFDYVHHPDRLTTPLIRKRRRAQATPTIEVDPRQPLDPLPRGDLGRGARRAPPPGLSEIRDAHGRQGAGGLRLGQGLERGGVSVPEAGAHRLRHQQRRPLHAALPRLVGRRADGDDRLGRGDGAVLGVRRMPTCIIVIGANPTVNHPVAATFIKNAVKRGAKLIVIDPRGQAPVAPRHASRCASGRAPTSRC